MSLILLVDDDEALLRAFSLNLRARHYEVATAPTGEQGLTLATALGPDLVIVDLGLPDLDGVEVVARLRSSSDVSILVLSARSDSPDKVAALDAGADDYVVKPASMEEFLARVRASLRRSRPHGDEPAVVRTAAFTVDLGARRVSTAEGEVRLTPTEWHLLEVLARSAGRLVPQVQLLQEVWGPAYSTETHYLRVYMAQLRRKLEPHPSAPRHLTTVPGVGYRLEP